MRYAFAPRHIARRAALTALCVTPLLAAPLAGPALAQVGDSGPGNVLLIIADDVGAEKIAAYGDDLGHDNPPITPTIDALAADGVRFTTAWSNPTCSPTRAGINTGRHAMRHGIGFALTGAETDPVLEPDEATLAEALGDDIGSALLGKWHLGTEAHQGGDDAPRQVGGFDRHAGGLGGGLPDYSRWGKAVDGVLAVSREYATFDATDETLDWVATQGAPWVAVVAYNAPHTPFHVPPGYEAELDGVRCNRPSEDILCYRAMLETLDGEVARLLDGLDADGALAETTVIFIGDNGSPAQVVEAPYVATKAKGTVYQGGVHVPFIVSGPSVAAPGRAVHAPVQTLDLFATILELAGRGAALDAVAAEATVDSVSVVPYLVDPAQADLRDHIYTEGFADGDTLNGDAAISDGQYKLVRTFVDGVVDAQACYDLSDAAAGADPEAVDVLSGGSLRDRRACRRLMSAMDTLRASAGL